MAENESLGLFSSFGVKQINRLSYFKREQPLSMQAAGLQIFMDNLKISQGQEEISYARL